jgi:cell wall assembly regulator SMI1
MADLQATLDELDALIRTRHPALCARFRPGLSVEQIGELAESLQPYHLPADLVALYRWHDGWEAFLDGDYCLLLPDAQFNSLGDAIVQYRAWWETLGADGWHPLWFPCFGDQSGELVVLQLEPDRSAGGLLSFHTEYELHTSYDSVATLFATTVDCWRTGLLPLRDPSYFPPEILKVIARHNPLSRTPEGVPRQELTRWSTTGWPPAWKEVLGIVQTAPAADELVVTIAEFLGDPLSGRPVRAEVAGWGGSFDAFVATATDATGSLPVLLTRDQTENFREFAGGERFELWLAPIADRGPVDELAANMRHIAELPAVAYIATRIVPL